MEINDLNIINLDDEGVEAEVDTANGRYQKNHEAYVKRLHEIQEKSAKLHAGEECTNVIKFKELEELLDILEC